MATTQSPKTRVGIANNVKAFFLLLCVIVISIVIYADHEGLINQTLETRQENAVKARTRHTQEYVHTFICNTKMCVNYEMTL